MRGDRLGLVWAFEWRGEDGRKSRSLTDCVEDFFGERGGEPPSPAFSLTLVSDSFFFDEVLLKRFGKTIEMTAAGNTALGYF